ERLERGVALPVEELEGMGRDIRIVSDLFDGVDRLNLFVQDVHVERVGLYVEKRSGFREAAEVADGLNHRGLATDETAHETRIWKRFHKLSEDPIPQFRDRPAARTVKCLQDALFGHAKLPGGHHRHARTILTEVCADRLHE